MSRSQEEEEEEEEEVDGDKDAEKEEKESENTVKNVTIKHGKKERRMEERIVERGRKKAGRYE